MAITLALTVGSLVAILIARARSRRRARAADSAFDASAPLGTGPSFVAGVVEHSRGADVAVKVVVELRGREWKTAKGRTVHCWEEVRRRTSALPFYLRHASGERVRVEPGNEPVLVDALD